MISPNVGTVVVATALVALFVLALVLALAQGKMSLLALGLTEHLFAIVLAVFVLERILTWREEPRWLAAKNWLYLLQLETIDDLLKQLLPATVAQEAAGTGEGSQSTWKPAFPVEASEFEVSTTSNSLTALFTRWCLHGVKKAWPKRRTSYLYC